MPYWRKPRGAAAAEGRVFPKKRGHRGVSSGGSQRRPASLCRAQRRWRSGTVGPVAEEGQDHGEGGWNVGGTLPALQKLVTSQPNLRYWAAVSPRGIVKLADRCTALRVRSLDKVVDNDVQVLAAALKLDSCCTTCKYECGSF